MTERSFDPNKKTFAMGLARIQKVVDALDIDQGRRILTSRDDVVVEALDQLEVDNIPDGFKKWQLPVHLDRPSQLFVTVGNPGVEVPEHSHDEGDGIRFIASGSIHYAGKELNAGDWMFIPAGKPYSFQVGRHGVIIVYAYCCCCA